jgi:hypothetical protein
MIEALIKFILRKLAGITAQQWSAALLWVLNTAREYRTATGTTKKERVLTVLKKQFPTLPDWKLDTLIQVAFAFLRHRKKA